jgi:alpha-ketoglutarate-dependent taurine dioxygenase
MKERQRCFDTFGLMLSGEHHELLKINPAALCQAVHFAGAVLLRDSEMDIPGFMQLSDACSVNFSSYAGAGFRGGPLHGDAIGESSASLAVSARAQAWGVPLHGECFYQRERPQFLWLYCDEAPESGGQTTFARAREVFAAMPADLQKYFRELRVRYVRYLEARQWQVVLGTTAPAAIQAFCKRNGLILERLEGDGWRTTFEAPAVCEDPLGPMFINALLLLWWGERAAEQGPTNHLSGKPPGVALVVRDASEQPLPADLMQRATECAESVTREHRWQQGDIAIVDNRTTLHGRRRPRDGRRNILVRLATAVA